MAYCEFDYDKALTFLNTELEKVFDDMKAGDSCCNIICDILRLVSVSVHDIPETRLKNLFEIFGLDLNDPDAHRLVGALTTAFFQAGVIHVQDPQDLILMEDPLVMELLRCEGASDYFTVIAMEGAENRSNMI